MRERIAKIIGFSGRCRHDMCSDAEAFWKYTNEEQQMTLEAQADAIIAALPSMVKPLEWVEECDFQCSEVFECETPFGKYSAFQAHDRDDWSWILEDGPLCPEEHGIKSMYEAKAKAAAHRVSLAMAAFGIEVKT